VNSAYYLFTRHSPVKMYVVAYNACLSILAYFLSNTLIAEFVPIFLKRRMFGIDQCKPKENPAQVPEPMGVVIATVYLMVLFVFIPAPFYSWLPDPYFPYARFVEFLSALISICCMIFLGFADDVLDLRWRHKLLFPTLASLPLLMVYAVNVGSTSIIVPKALKGLLGEDLRIGFLYYVYMGMMAVFCTNAINIYAGVNGLEAGQALVIAISVIIFNILQLLRLETEVWYHLFSLYILLPYVGVTAALLKWNWYPARVFVGDTFCYFSGMTFAVVGILGHFSKTLLLFFLPQIANFLYSTPQLFKFVPCPRHRLPKYDPATNTVQASRFPLSEASPLIQTVIRKLAILRIVRLYEHKDGTVECNNLTLINFVLIHTGPLREDSLVKLLLGLQAVCTVLAFGIRFFMAGLVYDVVQ